MMDFPYFNSKELSDGNTYDLTNPVDRHKYFHAKLGTKIDDVKEFLDHNTFVGYMMAKKLGGKGTCAKMLQEIIGVDRLAHVSVGDVVREVHEVLEEKNSDSAITAEKLREKLSTYYRGLISFEDAIDALLGRSNTRVSVPTELVLALLKMKIDDIGRKALLIDGMPRTEDQISYSLFFRDLINYRDDPDFFILIDVCEEILDTRMKGRVVCPVCQTSRNKITLPTSIVKYDKNSQEYYFICDNRNCAGYKKARYVAKEGDAKGIESIRERLDQDQKLIDMSFSLHGIPKLLDGSSYPIDIAHEYLEDYEIQPHYVFSGTGDDVSISTEPWIFRDEKGREAHTPYPAVHVLNMFVQLHEILVG